MRFNHFCDLITAAIGMSRRSTSKGIRNCVGLLGCLFAWFLITDLGFAQTNDNPVPRSMYSKGDLTGDIALSSQKDTPIGHAVEEIRVDVGLRNVVKVLHDKESNRVMLVGTKEDIAIVKRAIESFNKKFASRSNLIITDRVRLKFQMAETVAAILSNSMSSDPKGISNLKINPVHFPEAILLVGPKGSVAKAKKLIQRIDSHPDFESE